MIKMRNLMCSVKLEPLCTSSVLTSAIERWVKNTKMKRKHFLFVAIINHVFLMIVEFCDAKYSVHANDSVHLERCSVEDVRNIGEQNPSPEEIIIHDCRVEELPNALFIRFYRLKQLEITESQLHSISDFAFNGMKTLQLLNLSRNNLTSVQTWSNEPLASLHLLDLRRNSIVSLDKNAFIHYPNLLKLNLAVNHISYIPEDLFRTMPSLRYLNFAKNLLQTINANSFKHLHKLLNLELRHNQIEWIDSESFVGTTHMKVLHLQVSFNEIEFEFGLWGKRMGMTIWNAWSFGWCWMDLVSNFNRIACTKQNITRAGIELHFWNVLRQITD